MSNILSITSQIARDAGALLRGYFERRVRVEYKGEVDLVTEADRASEAFIVGELRKRFPDHAIVAEEGGGQAGSSEYRWYIDPLDGTTNFAHGFPIFAVSMGLERDGEMIAGVVYDPTREELFAAEKGSGAWLNGEPMRVSAIARLEEALVATGFPSRKRHTNPNIHFYHQMNMRTHGVRRPGAAAIDLAYVACGRLEAFWEFHLHAWDVAAGKLLVSEAGGRVTEISGQPHRMDSPSVLASNGVLHQQMLEAFEEIFEEKYRAVLPPLRRP
ncbi:MAG TPA: inositol monophosphatase family protein [Terriglobia bacterium]|nr:inositol monophosphatase family protein [Terriglobia bacterium]